jgi:hypothetical protein
VKVNVYTARLRARHKGVPLGAIARHVEMQPPFERLARKRYRVYELDAPL